MSVINLTLFCRLTMKSHLVQVPTLNRPHGRHCQSLFGHYFCPSTCRPMCQGCRHCRLSIKPCHMFDWCQLSVILVGRQCQCPLTLLVAKGRPTLSLAPWSGTPCRTTSAHSRTISPLNSAWKPGFSLATSMLSALIRHIVTVALYKFTFTITICWLTSRPGWQGCWQALPYNDRPRDAALTKKYCCTLLPRSGSTAYWWTDDDGPNNMDASAGFEATNDDERASSATMLVLAGDDLRVAALLNLGGMVTFGYKHTRSRHIGMPT